MIEHALKPSSMVGAAKYPPNYATAAAQNQVEPGPVLHSIGFPRDGDTSYRLVGLAQAIYSYGGAML